MNAGAPWARSRRLVAVPPAGRCERLPAGPLAVQLATPVRRKRFKPVFAKGGKVDQEVDGTGHPAGNLLSSLEHGFARYGWVRTDRPRVQYRLQDHSETA